MPQSDDQVICSHPSVPTIAVWEWMDGDELMVKSGHNLIRLTSRCDPGLRVIDKIPHSYRDSSRIDADVCFDLAVLTGPGPDISKHTFVQSSKIDIVQQCCNGRFSRSCKAQDIGLLRFI